MEYCEIHTVLMFNGTFDVQNQTIWNASNITSSVRFSYVLTQILRLWGAGTAGAAGYWIVGSYMRPL